MTEKTIPSLGRADDRESIELFHRGFLLCSGEVAGIPVHFQGLSLPGGLVFHRHPALSTVFQRSADGDEPWLLFAGHAIDVVDGESDAARLVERLLFDLAISESRFLARLDDLSGRFVMVCRYAGQVRVLHDAGGMNAVYYRDDQPLVGSHAMLLAQAGGHAVSAIQAHLNATGKKPQYGFPGNQTPYGHVMALTPNQMLMYPEQVLHRYFPRESLAPMSIDEAADIVLPGIRRQVDVLARGSKPMVASLTAGVDSRLSLVALRDHADAVEFFTYRRPGARSHDIDIALSQEIARRYRLKHRIIEIGVDERENAEYASFRKQLENLTHYRHGHALAFRYHALYGGRNMLHLRSNLSEIGRAFYRKRDKALPSAVADPRQLMLAYAPDMIDDEVVVGAFQTFFDQTRFREITNYDPYDMLYWEHRMGCWHSNVVLESDLAFDSHVLLNARRLLNALLAVPLADRLAASVFNRLIDRQLPELADLPMNPRAWSPAA